MYAINIQPACNKEGSNKLYSFTIRNFIFIIFEILS
jgi:hypothetical protein